VPRRVLDYAHQQTPLRGNPYSPRRQFFHPGWSSDGRAVVASS
jgi:hypothetical protein